MKLILYSHDDLAGCNIARLIVNEYGFGESGEYCYGSPIYKRGDILLIGTHSSVRDLTELPYQPEVCIVASRHKSESGKPTLTCHPTGNYGAAEMGGADGRLQLTDALILRQTLEKLREKKAEHSLEYEVSLEVTHHGPTDLPFPLLYAEVGSSEKQWVDEVALDAVAETIYEVLKNGVEERRSAIGFGGPHYAPNFNGLVEDMATGHIMPKYAIEHLTKPMVAQMMEKTRPNPEVAVVDWKGLRGGDKGALTGILDELSVEWVKSSDVK
jgi:D-aminoacyl-tRNA deacylase